MRTLVALLFVAALAAAQNCNSNYGQYLNCIKGALDKDYGGYENEFGNNYKDLVWSCFTNSQSEFGQKCFMRDKSVLDSAYDENGPLKDCAYCKKLAAQVKKMFLEANESVVACIRGVLSKAIGAEMENCIKGKDSTFVMPPLPDFDASSQPYRQKMIDNAGVCVMADYTLDRCERNSDARPSRSVSENPRMKRSAFTGTQQCMAARILNGKPIWPKTCGTMKSCRSTFGSCLQTFQQTEKYACDCIEEKRVKIQGIIKSTASSLIKIVQTPSVTANSDSCATTTSDNGVRLSEWKECQCKALAKKVIDTNSNERIDLRATFNKILDCTKVDANTRDLLQLDNLISVGCRRISRGGAEGARAASDLLTGVDFITKLFDALVLRVTRFCPGKHCPGVGA